MVWSDGGRGTNSPRLVVVVVAHVHSRVLAVIGEGHPGRCLLHPLVFRVLHRCLRVFHTST